MPSIIEFLAEKLGHQPELARLFYVGLFELDSADQQVFRKQLGMLLEPVDGYLTRCVASGRLRCSDAQAATFGLVASVVIHHAAPDLLHDASSRISDSMRATAGCIQFCLEVLVAPCPRIAEG